MWRAHGIRSRGVPQPEDPALAALLLSYDRRVSLPELDRLLAARLPGSVAAVITLMRAIGGALPRDDGIAAFTRLYLAVTEAVDASVLPGRFHDPRFLRRLDVVFANLYFGALRHAIRTPSSLPRAWAPLIEARGRRGIVPIQFALAGMNAHINRDLPLALVRTWEATGVEPERFGPQHRDFSRVTVLLAEAEERVKPWLATGALGHVDRSLGAVDDVLAIWNVHKAREAAWIHGETLWALRGVPSVRAEYVRALDRLVGFAGRGLLRPVSFSH
jgi:hypothetical protein